MLFLSGQVLVYEASSHSPVMTPHPSQYSWTGGALYTVKTKYLHNSQLYMSHMSLQKKSNKNRICFFLFMFVLLNLILLYIF